MSRSASDSATDRTAGGKLPSCISKVGGGWGREKRSPSDYRQRIPKESGRFRTGYALDQYQFWVICKIAAFMQLLRADLNGSTYTKDAAQIIAKHQKYLSYEVFVYDTNMHRDSAA
jgi:cytochrome P450